MDGFNEFVTGIVILFVLLVDDMKIAPFLDRKGFKGFKRSLVRWNLIIAIIAILTIMVIVFR